MKNNKLLNALLNELNDAKNSKDVWRDMYLKEKNGTDEKRINDIYRFFMQYLNTYFTLRNIVKKAYGDENAEKLLENL